MLRLAMLKLFEAALVCVMVSIITFGLVHWTGDLAVAMGGLDASADDLARLRRVHGLDRSLVEQYLGWGARVVHGDLGTSFFSQEDVLTLILEHLPVTGMLASLSLLSALLIALPLGVLSALKPGSWADRVALSFAVLGQAMPSYWSALLLILLFGVNLQWLPISGTDSWTGYILPTLSLAWYVMPVLMRLTRTGMIDVMRADYIRTARAKGLPMRTVLFKHALRNALMPVVAVAMVQLGVLLGGSIVVESVFALNGVGQLAWQAIQRSDFPVVQALVLMIALIFVLLNLLSDLFNALLDPRLRSA
jgi:ABC-type dipeptide/oligopeptide/nickel transport system permease component